MLKVQITVSGDRVAIANLGTLAEQFPAAIKRSLKRIAAGTHREAHAFLSGAGAGQSISRRTRQRLADAGDITGFTKKTGERVDFKLYQNSGGYPVPVRTGHLRRMLDFLYPGQSKSGPSGTFTAGPMETVIFNSAAYASAIHEGRNSSAKFGPRSFLTDALMRFNEGAQIKRIVEEEINREIARIGG